MKLLKRYAPLLVILLLATFIYGWNLWNEDVNLYYAAGVYSMSQNWKSFFFAALDSTAFISIDKPALGLWIQVVFQFIFGFNNFALLLPQVLAGLATIGVVYKMVLKRAGIIAATIASIVLTLTPIFVAVSRNNSQDTVMILLLVLATGAALKAVETSNIKPLLIASLLIGLGFNIKMLAAYMIVPAVYLSYFIFAKRKCGRKTIEVGLAGLLAIVVSLIWAVIVDLTPSTLRPYVGSSTTNSVIELIIGYNGINRIFGGAALVVPTIVGSLTRVLGRLLPPPPSGSGGGGSESGTAGLFRLFESQMGGQIAWFLLPAIIYGVWLVIKLIQKKYESPWKMMAIMVGIDVAAMFIYFSFSSGLAHRYYLAEFAPFIAILVGLGVADLLKAKASRNVWLTLFIVVAVTQVIVQIPNINWQYGWLIAFALLLIGGIVLFIFAFRKNGKDWVRIASLSCLLILPMAWSITPLIYGSNSQLPIAGPELENENNAFSNRPDLTVLVNYLETNAPNAKYLAAVKSSMELGSELILQSNGNIMCIGGFNGSDDPLTLVEFQALVDSGDVIFGVTTLGPSSTPGGETTGGTSEIMTWIKTKTVVQQTSVYRVYRLD